MKAIAKIGKRNGKQTVTIAPAYVEAAATLPVYYKNYEPWMLKVEEKVRNGKPVYLEDLGYMACVSTPCMTPAQTDLKAELVGLYHAHRKAA